MKKKLIKILLDRRRKQKNAAVEIYDSLDAANPTSETDAVGNWTLAGGGGFVESVASGITTPKDGSYCLNVFTTAAVTQAWTGINIAVTGGKTYDFSLWGKQAIENTPSNSRFRIYNVDSSSTSFNVSTTDWVETTHQLVATGTGNIVIRAYATQGTAEICRLFVDLASILETD